jgi:hypothetical protein
MYSVVRYIPLMDLPSTETSENHILKYEEKMEFTRDQEYVKWLLDKAKAHAELNVQDTGGAEEPSSHIECWKPCPSQSHDTV